MLLTRLQHLIGAIYDVSIAHDVVDFLVTDRRRLPAAARGGTAEEELLIAEPGPEGTAGGTGEGEAAVSLYLDPALLKRLERADPLERLHAGNVADYCTALEGVSHFLYLAWNAGHDRPVSVQELEMQAEVDKYVASYWLLRRQLPGHFPSELRPLLFDRARIDPRLGAGRAAMYREASRYAQRYCSRLERRLARGRAAGAAAEREGGTVLAQLRRFYRLPHARKRAFIEAME